MPPGASTGRSQRLVRRYEWGSSRSLLLAHRFTHQYYTSLYRPRQKLPGAGTDLVPGNTHLNDPGIGRRGRSARQPHQMGPAPAVRRPEPWAGKIGLRQALHAGVGTAFAAGRPRPYPYLVNDRRRRQGVNVPVQLFVARQVALQPRAKRPLRRSDIHVPARSQRECTEPRDRQTNSPSEFQDESVHAGGAQSAAPRVRCGAR